MAYIPPPWQLGNSGTFLAKQL